MRTIFLLLLCGIFSQALSQSHSWRLTTSTGDTLSNISFVQVNGDSLEISRDSVRQWVSMGPISEIRYVRDSHMKEKATAYATYSAIVAASISAVFYISMATAPGDSSNTSIVTKIFMSSLGIVFTGGVFGLVGGLVGGIIGLCEGIDTVYGVSTQTVDQKRALLQKIIEER